jgi:DUF971 family protein
MMGAPPSTVPGQITLCQGEALEIRWADGHQSRFPLPLLRSHCPCATCRADQEKGPLRVLRGAVPGRLEALEVAPVGHYALRVAWNDGHQTGIYSFSLLRDLCPCGECRSPGGSRPPLAGPSGSALESL